MYAINTYEEIESQERELNEKHVIILLFARPSLAGAQEVIDEFNYLHENAGRYCSLYAVGYGSGEAQRYGLAEDYQGDLRPVPGVEGQTWQYSDRAFVDFKNKLEDRLKNWCYSGNVELMILQSNPQGRQILNFEQYLAVDLHYGLKHGYIESFPAFMEALIRNARSEVTASGAIRSFKGQHIKVNKIMQASIDECSKLPKSIKNILKDQLFYRTSKKR